MSPPAESNSGDQIVFGSVNKTVVVLGLRAFEVISGNDLDSKTLNERAGTTGSPREPR